MTIGLAKKSAEQVTKFAEMMSAMGTEPRLRIMQLLLSAHPEGLVVGDIQEELEIPNSTLSHHLDKLKNEKLVPVKRESTFLRYTANTEALQELMQFFVRNAARGTRRSGRETSLKFVDRRPRWKTQTPRPQTSKRL